MMKFHISPAADLGAISLIKGETILYTILIFLHFPCYFSLLAQRKVTIRLRFQLRPTRKKRRPAPRFFLRVADPAGSAMLGASLFELRPHTAARDDGLPRGYLMGDLLE
jgi:hypothetical protein